MTYTDIEPYMQYAYLIGLMLSVYFLYSYIWYMYRSDKQGKTDYENLANVALDDNIDSKTINTADINASKKKKIG